MQFSDPPRRKPAESVVPMINVVFLLLIFFLMSARIAPPEPFEVDPPRADREGRAAEGDFTLYMDAEGRIAYGEIIGADEALAALEAARERYCAQGGCSQGMPPPPLILRADGKVDATHLAAALPRIGAAGFADVRLVTAPQ